MDALEKMTISFSGAPLRTLAAHLMKAPARAERALLRRRPQSPELAWRWVGGWEVLGQLEGLRESS